MNQAKRFRVAVAGNLYEEMPFGKIRITRNGEFFSD